MKKLSSILALSGVLALGIAAQAQDPGAPPADAAPPADPGVTVTTETTVEQPAPDTMIVGTDDPGTMPATGGAPLAMALAGTLTAAGAFFVRRKLS